MDKVFAIIVIIIILTLSVATIEFFVPLGVKWDFNQACRKALLSVEINGELLQDVKNDLETDLSNLKCFDISITTTGGSAQGDMITLKVQSKFKYSKLISLTSRSNEILAFNYTKTTVIRKVIN